VDVRKLTAKSEIKIENQARTRQQLS